MRQLKKKKTLNGLSAGCAHIQISCDYDKMDMNFVVTVGRENTHTQTPQPDLSEYFPTLVSISLVAEGTCVEHR